MRSARIAAGALGATLGAAVAGLATQAVAQAMFTALSGTIGIGNIAGVGIAIAWGGPTATGSVIRADRQGLSAFEQERTLFNLTASATCEPFSMSAIDPKRTHMVVRVPRQVRHRAIQHRLS